MKVFVTGANRGLGLSLVESGLERGHIIFAAVRSVSDKQIHDLQQLKEKYEGQLRIIHMDVTNEKSVEQAAEAVKLTDQYLDVIINNAAILNERDKTIEELDIHACLQAFDVNTLGPMRVVKHFLPVLRRGLEQKTMTNQAVINISSEAGSLSNAYSGDYPYGMTKVALNMLTEKLKVYLKDDDIDVLSIHPGWMKTDMGGESAPKLPKVTADNIFAVIENGLEDEQRFAFIDDTGTPMDI
ncbi:SDR family oxidoreductase [Gracilibacillus kekensis]|uniref:NAD(P)-dependent dehydrogenase, short-chain alcohol dehydrogenase family n=1 Tax=Gracilibacillus kekensis TaxID=1027249 RepID=A0A1M7JF50_9BACI|nr:SDR family oxidoreductase [Gracilibacillus kekensis]SHM51588.1 NAD(P)-dependent dehydrogenase, short-chain alcohol dehydrogenase family [Gracilibacillus kekensis]